MALDDLTTGNFVSGKKYVSFGGVGMAAGTEQLVSKDNTTAKQHALLWFLAFNCATGGNVAFFDGSEKSDPFFRLHAGGDVTIGNVAQALDFRDDPVDLDNEDGTCLCISCTGTFNGFIKYGWGS